MKELFKEQRKAMIAEYKDLSARRVKIKGVRGTGALWDELTTKMGDLQKRIDLISKSLGYPVTQNRHQSPGKIKGQPYKEVKKAQVAKGRADSKGRTDEEIQAIYIAG